MDQSLDNQAPEFKIYKEKAISLAAFLGGPLAVGYLMAENFKSFNDANKVKLTWIISILVTVVVFGGSFLIPENVKIPNFIIPAIYISASQFLIKKYQGADILAHINSGGAVYGWGRSLAVGITALSITLIPIFGFIYSTLSTNDYPDSKMYGNVKNEIVFNKSNISDAEVDKIANGLIQTAFFNEEVKQYAYVKKVGSDFEISFVLNTEIANNANEVLLYKQFRDQFQTLFPSNKIVFNLVVETLDNVVKRIE